MGRSGEQVEDAAGVVCVRGFAENQGIEGDDGVGAEDDIFGEFCGDGFGFGAGEKDGQGIGGGFGGVGEGDFVEVGGMNLEIIAGLAQQAFAPG